MKQKPLLFILIYGLCLPDASAQQNPKHLEVQWQTDLDKRDVALDEFTILLQPDAIPPIDEPVFVEPEKASTVFFAHEPVIAVEVRGEAKAYPLSILTYHEIVNDRLGGTPVTVTYCPLCNAAIVFDRRLQLEGEDYLLDFGVSGMLRNSDMVMWDRQTESWWQQFTGTALVGALTGAQLTLVPSLLISFEEFVESYPEGLVLSTETGHNRLYGMNPYTTYDDTANAQPMLFNGKPDNRLPAMERVVDVHVNGKYRIYPWSVIRSEKVINDTFQDTPVVVFFTSKTVSVLDNPKIADSKEVGSVTVFDPVVDGDVLLFAKKKKGFVDDKTGSVWNIAGQCISGPLKGRTLQPINHGNHFAFAWLAFHPDSDIYSK